MDKYARFRTKKGIDYNCDGCREVVSRMSNKFRSELRDIRCNLEKLQAPDEGRIDSKARVFELRLGTWRTDGKLQQVL